MAEMVAIIMALTYLIDIPQSIFRILICVDSRSVLQSIRFYNGNSHNPLLHEICHLIHVLICKGSDLTFCWVPSHCGIRGNELADKCAKIGARNEACASSLKIPLTLPESYHLLKNASCRRFNDYESKSASYIKAINGHTLCFENISNNQYLRIHNVYQYRNFMSTFHRLKLDAFRTKYSSAAKCICGNQGISSRHVLFDCLPLKVYLPSLTGISFSDIFCDFDLALSVTFSLINSPVRHLL